MKKWLMYSRATKSGGAVVKSTSAGGGAVVTSSSGGGTQRSTESGGGTVTTSGQSEGFVGTLPAIAVDGEEHIHLFPNELVHHTHEVSIDPHSHAFSTPNHTHDVSIEPHVHEVEIPSHSHDVEHEIIELEETPTEVTIKVDGNTVPFTGTSGDRIDLVDYMRKESNGKVARGRHEVELSPDALARIEADLILRVFIRSHLGGTH